ncbi:hypothetical protein OG230_00640 [Streptomyces sp. NBC_00234]|uniref:hypothetical protein n=1 Tax=Streptomyces sp. NBC_00234 TaxID=2903638 RepID=UPI002E2998C6|nr:hypothetical protein [Streptomyces sp. NBC_00234]
MAATSPASRLVTAAARQHLRPLGLRQRGRSRLWLDDHGWWLGVVDFFSPQWSQGSGLTVGVMWLWQDVGHVTFHVHERVEASQEFRHEKQFAGVVERLAHDAEERVGEFRNRFADLDAVARALLSQPVRGNDLWGNFHAGVTAALVGRASEARERFSAVLAQDPFADWIQECQQTAQYLYGAAEDAAAVRAWARDAVVSCRAKLALGDVPASAGDLLA